VPLNPPQLKGPGIGHQPDSNPTQWSGSRRPTNQLRRDISKNLIDQTAVTKRSSQLRTTLNQQMIETAPRQACEQEPQIDTATRIWRDTLDLDPAKFETLNPV
jgi:hypothetical protein